MFASVAVPAALCLALRRARPWLAAGVLAGGLLGCGLAVAEMLRTWHPAAPGLH